MAENTACLCVSGYGSALGSRRSAERRETRVASSAARNTRAANGLRARTLKHRTRMFRNKLSVDATGERVGYPTCDGVGFICLEDWVTNRE